MAFTPSTIAAVGNSDTSPQLSANQRARFRFSLVLNPTTGRYVIGDATDTWAHAYAFDDTDGRVRLTTNEGGSRRLVQQANGRFTV